MHRYARMLLASLTATAIVAAAAGSSSARNISSSNRNIRITWSALRFNNTVLTEQVVACPVTIEGSFHSATIRKVARALIGHVTRAQLSNAVCTGGNATVNQETLPWHIQYESFAGRLPNIERVTLLLVGASFIIRTAGNTCRATTTTTNPSAGIASVAGSGLINGFTADESRLIPLVNGPGGALCGLAGGRLSGLGNLTVLGTSNFLVTINLI